MSVAVGAACSTLPFFGFTTVLNLAVGFWLKLNQPAMQILNQLLGPVQLALIIVYVRAGEFLWQASPVSLSVPTLVQSFKSDPSLFLARFGWTGVHAGSAWLLSVPLIVCSLFYALRAGLRRLGRPRTSTLSAGVQTT